MKSLFGSLQGKFNATYEGRFFSTILADVLQAEPRALRAVFPGFPKQYRDDFVSGNAIVTTEHRLANGRRADLAVLVGGEPVALAEVKQRDIKSSGVAAQLADYMTEIRRLRKPLHFSLLSEFEPSAEQKAIIAGSPRRTMTHLVRFHQVATDMAKLKGCAGARLFLDYMKEQRMVGYTPLPKQSGRNLKLLMSRLVPVQHANGLGRLQSNESIQNSGFLLRTLMGNLKYMEEWLRLANEKRFPRVFTNEFRVWPHFDKAKLAVYLREGSDDDDDRLPRRYCKGGGLDIYAQATVSAAAMGAPRGNRITLDLGYWLELDISTGKLYQEIGASCFGPKSLFPDAEGGQISAYSTCDYASPEAKVKRVLRRNVENMLKEAAKQSRRKAVTKFLRSIDLRGF